MVAAACMFTSCGEKDGVFNPKEKISAIYYSATEEGEALESESGEWVPFYNSVPKVLKEKWNWDGKKLSSLELYNYDYRVGNTTLETIVRFEYDGNRVEKMYAPLGDYDNIEHTFVYEGKRLKKIQVSDGRTNIDYLGFEYEGDKLSRVTLLFAYYDKKSMNSKKAKVQNHLSELLLRTYIPGYEMTPRIKEEIEKGIVAQSKKNDGYDEMTVKYEWDGDNISSIWLGAEGETVRFAYDDKKNPIHGFLPMIMLSSELAETYVNLFSENNVVEISIDEEVFARYSYTYDGKWPTTRTSIEKYTSSIERGSYTEVLYYEYK